MLAKYSSCCLPITKNMYFRYLARTKIFEDADERLLTVVELFKLAIFKTLKEKGSSAQRKAIKLSIDKMFAPSYLLYKII